MSSIIQTPLVLEVNTFSTTLREVVDRIVIRQLGANSPIIMLGSNVIYETGDDLEKDMIVLFEKNLDKVFCASPRKFGLHALSASEMTSYKMSWLVSALRPPNVKDLKLVCWKMFFLASHAAMLLFSWIMFFTGRNSHFSQPRL